MYKLQKVKNYPLPHTDQNSFYLSLFDAAKGSTSIAIAHYDEGLGSPSSVNANPEHASFVAKGYPNCFPESEIDNIFFDIRLQLTKHALETDKVHKLRIAIQEQYVSFEDALAVDDLSSVEVQDALELTRETTDKQTYPLYSGTKLDEVFSGSATLNAAVPGLTTNQIIESVAYDPLVHYNAVHFLTIKGKYNTCQSGLRWVTLTKDNPYKNIRIRLKPKLKNLQEYAYQGVLIHLPQKDTYDQAIADTDLSTGNHVQVTVVNRFNEWNHRFDMERQ